MFLLLMNSLSARLVRVPDAGIYMVGLAVFPSHNPLHHASSTLLSAPQPPSSAIEVRQILSLFISSSYCFSLITSFVSNYLFLTFDSDAAVSCTELRCSRSSVLLGVCHTRSQLTSPHQIPDLQTLLSLP